MPAQVDLGGHVDVRKSRRSLRCALAARSCARDTVESVATGTVILSAPTATIASPSRSSRICPVRPAERLHLDGVAHRQRSARRARARDALRRSMPRASRRSISAACFAASSSTCRARVACASTVGALLAQLAHGALDLRARLEQKRRASSRARRSPARAPRSRSDTSRSSMRSSRAAARDASNSTALLALVELSPRAPRDRRAARRHRARRCGSRASARSSTSSGRCRRRAMLNAVRAARNALDQSIRRRERDRIELQRAVHDAGDLASRAA